MKAQIVKLIGLEKGPNYPDDIDDPKIYPYPFVKKEALNTQYQDYFRYCIVRNPWDRLVSCFKDKIRSVNDNSEGFIKGIANPLAQNSPLFYGGMSFEEFVKVVCSIPDATAEHHFSSQLFQILDSEGNLYVNYIGKLETISKDLKNISQKTTMPFEDFPHLHKTGGKTYQAYYTDELIEKVRERFSADIDFFGYQFDDKTDVHRIGVVGPDVRQRLFTSSAYSNILIQKNIGLININNNLKKINDSLKNNNDSLIKINESLRINNNNLKNAKNSSIDQSRK